MGCKENISKNNLLRLYLVGAANAVAGHVAAAATDVTAACENLSTRNMLFSAVAATTGSYSCLYNILLYFTLFCFIFSLQLSLCVSFLKKKIFFIFIFF